ncbi:MAG: uroporphyrinogen-III synthase [Alphaproteobacteria bacterium]|jgi:uroporphyrinogen-III synthase
MTFLIARPTDKAEKTAAFFRQSGLQAQALPIIDIELATRNSLIEQLNNTTPNYLIVTSTYAALWLISIITAQKLILDFSHTTFVCVGKASAALVQAISHKYNVVVASPENSEGLLQSDCLQTVNNANIVVLKGEGGRDLIASTLVQQNANVSALNVYKRVTNIQAIRAFTFEPSQIKCIIATSIEITELLLANMDHSGLASCFWIVASERIKDYAYKNGIQHISVSQGAGNQALLACANQLVNTGVVHD